MGYEDLKRQEDRKIRLLRITTDLLVQTLMTQKVNLNQAERMILGVRQLAMNLFPGKEQVFDLIYMPRFRRAMLAAGMADHRGNLRVLKSTDENNGEE